MKKFNLFLAMGAALLVAGQAKADNMYPGAWVTECGKDAPADYEANEKSLYSFHCFNPNNGDEAIFAKYGKQEVLTAAEQARIKEVFKEINADLDTTSLDLATFDPKDLGGYADWRADYEISFDQAVEATEYKLAGSYDAYNEGAWVVTNGEALAAAEVKGLMSALDPNLKYYELVAGIPVFNCGVIAADAAVAGKTISVSLFIYNPKDASEKKLINKTDYTFGSTGLVSVKSNKMATKRIVNGQLVIVKDGKMFNAIGAEL